MLRNEIVTKLMFVHINHPTEKQRTGVTPGRTKPAPPSPTGGKGQTRAVQGYQMSPGVLYRRVASQRVY